VIPKFSAAFLLLAMALPTGAAAEDAHSIANAVDAHYNRLHTLQSDFTEVYRGSGMERTESGTLWLTKGGLKKPGKMRWEYRSPREKLFVSDGKDAWFYVPGDRQARKTEARKMAEFLVKVADEQGHLRQQVEHGYSEAEVHDRFAQQGYLVYWVKPRTMLSTGGGQFGRRKLRQSTFLIFNQQFLTLIKAGLPILDRARSADQAAARQVAAADCWKTSASGSKAASCFRMRSPPSRCFRRCIRPR
jgi:hypothetical protein